MTTYITAMYGALTAMSTVAALFFLRYWRTSRDRFFLWFAGAFAAFGVSWILVLCDDHASEHAAHIYAIRLLGFLAIITAILLKNQRR